MEDSLRGNKRTFEDRSAVVLILVLVEDSLRVLLQQRGQKRRRVLILVLVEDSLRVIPMSQIYGQDFQS